MRKRIIAAIAAVMAVLGLTLAGTAQAAGPPPARMLPVTRAIAGAASTARPAPAPVYMGQTTIATATAADPTGICWSGSSPQACWRESNTAIDLWPQDIAADVWQQFSVYYDGTASSQGCKYPVSWGPGVGVYSFKDHSGHWVGAGYFSGGVYYVGNQSSYDHYAQWEWGSNGALANCGDINAQNTAFYLQTDGQWYVQLWTSTNTTAPAWGGVHV